MAVSLGRPTAGYKVHKPNSFTPRERRNRRTDPNARRRAHRAKPRRHRGGSARRARSRRTRRPWRSDEPRGPARPRTGCPRRSSHVPTSGAGRRSRAVPAPCPSAPQSQARCRRSRPLASGTRGRVPRRSNGDPSVERSHRLELARPRA